MLSDLNCGAVGVALQQIREGQLAPLIPGGQVPIVKSQSYLLYELPSSCMKAITPMSGTKEKTNESPSTSSLALNSFSSPAIFNWCAAKNF